MNTVAPRFVPLLRVAVCAVMTLAACTGGAAGSPATDAPTAGPTAGPPGSPAAPTGSAGGPVTSPAEAVARVVAEHPEFDGIGPFDPNLIGGCCWYRVAATEGGYEVVVRIGWGDCPAGCIDEHVWTFHVGPDGSVELVAESGDPIPPGGIPPGGAGY